MILDQIKTILTLFPDTTSIKVTVNKEMMKILYDELKQNTCIIGENKNTRLYPHSVKYEVGETEITKPCILSIAPIEE